jgi:hypothetical protein
MLMAIAQDFIVAAFRLLFFTQDIYGSCERAVRSSESVQQLLGDNPGGVVEQGVYRRVGRIAASHTRAAAR